MISGVFAYLPVFWLFTIPKIMILGIVITIKERPYSIQNPGPPNIIVIKLNTNIINIKLMCIQITLQDNYRSLFIDNLFSFLSGNVSIN